MNELRLEAGKISWWIVALFHKKTSQLARTALAHKTRHLSVICEISLVPEATRRLSCDHCRLARGAPCNHHTADWHTSSLKFIHNSSKERSSLSSSIFDQITESSPIKFSAVAVYTSISSSKPNRLRTAWAARRKRFSAAGFSSKNRSFGESLPVTSQLPSSKNSI